MREDAKEHRRAYLNNYMRRRRQEKWKKGICKICTTHQAIFGTTYCVKCRERIVAWNKAKAAAV